jgi:hypothetical protein
MPRSYRHNINLCPDVPDDDGMFRWWGYRHTSGSIHVRRYFDDGSIEDARESPFCEQVVDPFECDSRAEAVRIVTTATRIDNRKVISVGSSC